MKAITGVARAFGPTKDHQRQFGRSFIGTLLGQATALLLMLLVYITALALLGRFAIDPLRSLKIAIGQEWFWVLAATPVICIIAFSLTPTLWRAARERRLKKKLFTGEMLFRAGYFRLYPYDESDSELFHRLDGAGDKIRNWLKSTSSPVLYLSGASGVGKSSLLAADVIPTLRSEGWAIVQTRLFGNPIEHLRAALTDEPGLFARGPSPDVSIRTLLERLGDSRKRRGDSSLLLVIDQFEEFMILNDESARAPFAQLLEDITKNPIGGIRILLIFRSDYRALVFKLELPPLLAHENWEELPPYDRGEATVFIQGGGRRLSPEALDDLFGGLDRIDGTPGLYRPITLNMVGLVLERMGRALEGDPAQLVQHYLRNCLTGSESRDFVKPILTKMISDTGTKEPRTAPILAAATGFQLWQVQASLADLADRGVVRRLEGKDPIWEISHDFVARILGQLIGRTKPGAFLRIRPFIAPTVLCGWIALTAVALVSGFRAPDPAHLAVHPDKPFVKDGEFIVNVHIINDGKLPAVGLEIKGDAVKSKDLLGEEEESRFFEALVGDGRRSFKESDSQIDPKHSVFFTQYMGASNEQNNDIYIYVMGILQYSDSHLTDRTYYITEYCFAISQQSAPIYCQGHNRTYLRPSQKG